MATSDKAFTCLKTSVPYFLFNYYVVHIDEWIEMNDLCGLTCKVWRRCATSCVWPVHLTWRTSSHTPASCMRRVSPPCGVSCEPSGDSTWRTASHSRGNCRGKPCRLHGCASWAENFSWPKWTKHFSKARLKLRQMARGALSSYRNSYHRLSSHCIANKDFICRLEKAYAGTTL